MIEKLIEMLKINIENGSCIYEDTCWYPILCSECPFNVDNHKAFLKELKELQELKND